MTDITLGSFTLARPLASGGMGEVWLAFHSTGDPVAIKVILAEGEHARGVVDSLQAEIRAVAALDHPHIVRVFDAGVISSEVAAASQGRFAQGVPWLAMEWARGTLSDLGADLSWEALEAALLQVLDALAHAHARGLVHRDLKPANVLYVDRDGERCLLLADFGMATALEGKPQFDGGTMPFMAPEQWLNAWTEQGPWTDLYALGCMTWRLVTGRVPFTSRNPEAQRQSHLFSPVPVMIPRFPVPPELDAWVRTCLAKDPRQRFQRAADAAFALLQLGPIDPAESVGAPPSGTDTALGRVNTTTHRSLPVDQWAQAPPSLAGLDAAEADEGAALRAPVPVDWRRADAAATGPAARGLGLIGLSEPPMVGRETERDLLWQLLVGSERLQPVIVRGAAGLGKSRLARWLAERAHEVGAAEVFRAQFTRQLESGTGLAGLLEDHLRTHGMGGAEVLRHLKHALRADGIKDPWQAKVLAQLLRPGDPVVGTVSLAGREDRYDVIWQLMKRRTAARRMIVWLDDVHWSHASLAFANWVLQHGNETPGVVLITVREEALDVDLRQELNTIQASYSAVQMRLGALPRGATAELVRQTLPVDDEVARRVEALSGGNPLFAVQLVADLAEKGRLRGDLAGVSIEEAELPASLRAVWTTALQQLYGASPGARSVLEAAAVLGSSLAHAEWSQVCHKRNTELTPHMCAVIAQRGLLTAGAGGARWTFVHALLRDEILAVAEAQGRLIPLHRACAEVLGHRDPSFAARRAHHLDCAGDVDAAVDASLEALTWLAEWDRQRALELADDFERLLQGRSEDPRWIPALRTMIGIHRSDRSDTYPSLVQRLFHLGRALQDRVAEAFALVELAHIDLLKLQLPRAEARAELAVHLATRGDDRDLQLRATIGRAEIRRHRGERDVAEAMLRDALELAQTPVEEQRVLVALSLVLAENGAWEEADRLLLEYADRHTLVQAPMFRSRLQHARGRVLLTAGKTARAVVALEEAVMLRERAGFRLPLLDLDLGFAWAADGQGDRARKVMEQALGRFPADRDALHRVSCLAALAALDAFDGRVDAVERHLAQLEQLPVQGVRSDAPQRLQEAAARIEALGHPDLGRRLSGLARAQLAAASAPDGARSP